VFIYKDYLLTPYPIPKHQRIKGQQSLKHSTPLSA